MYIVHSTSVMYMQYKYHYTLSMKLMYNDIYKYTNK